MGIQALFRSIIDVNYLTSNDNFMSWKKSKLYAAIQWILIIVSLIDFTVYTLNFLYGIYLVAAREGSMRKKLSTLGVGVAFLLVRFFYLPFLFLLIPTEHLLIMHEWVYDV
jgi:hypothetical protein